MRKNIVLAAGFMLASASAHADGSLSGKGALALAALVGAHSPNVTSHDKKRLSSMLNGNLDFAYPAKGKIAVTADSVACRASDVDISEHDCTLK